MYVLSLHWPECHRMPQNAREKPAVYSGMLKMLYSEVCKIVETEIGLMKLDQGIKYS